MKKNYGALGGCVLISIISTAVVYWLSNCVELPTGLGMELLWVVAIITGLGGISLSKPLMRISIFAILGGLIVYLMLPVVGLLVLVMGFNSLIGVFLGRSLDNMMGAFSEGVSSV